ncbi:glycosyltransferase family 39 protein [Streptomyces sp. NPDC005271]|uniref:glycosyltransferase family 39 protein n=1 Tax=unclassified Streptomyces TaxID=2593676 RepID=UPI0033BFAEB2
MRIPRRVVLAPMAVMLCLGLWGLERGTMWRDESATYQMTQRTLRQILRAMGGVDAVHGLYYLLMHPVLAASPSEVALRLPSLLASMAATGLVAALGCRLARPRAGLWAGLLYAATPMVGHYAQEGRSYALVAAGAAWATWLLVGAVERCSAASWVAYGTVVTVTALLHVFAVLLLAAHALTLLASRAPRRAWRGWGLAATGAVAAVAPLARLARRQSAQIAWIPEPGPGRLWALAHHFAGPSGLILAINALLIAVALARPRRTRPRRPSLTAVALPLALTPPLLLFALSQYRPLFQERYLLFALAGVPLLAAAGADRLVTAVTDHRHTAVATAGAIAVGGAFLWQLPLHAWERAPASRQDDLAALAQAVGRLTRPGEPVLYDPPKERRIAIAYPRPLAGLRDVALAVPGPASGTLYGIDVGPSELLRRLGTARGAWVVAADEPKSRRAKTAVLTGHFRLAYSLCLPGVRLERYVRRNTVGAR